MALRVLKWCLFFNTLYLGRFTHAWLTYYCIHGCHIRMTACHSQKIGFGRSRSTTFSDLCSRVCVQCRLDLFKLLPKFWVGNRLQRRDRSRMPDMRCRGEQKARQNPEGQLAVLRTRLLGSGKHLWALGRCFHASCLARPRLHQQVRDRLKPVARSARSFFSVLVSRTAVALPTVLGWRHYCFPRPSFKHIMTSRMNQSGPSTDP